LAARTQWLDDAEISARGFGVTKDEVEEVLRTGQDEPDPRHLARGRRFKLGKLKDGRTLRIEYTEDRGVLTVQVVAVDPDRLD